MKNQNSTIKNAVAAIRISSLKQGLQGDSPEAQKEQIERFALARQIHIKKFFIFMESASQEQQPVQEAIDYCIDPKNNIQLFLIKSIDRFTRGGSYLYDHLKMQLQKHHVGLLDIYGIIGSQDVNTLEHLGLSYDWSVYSPTKKSEILEAERAKDEMRDIMTRMIGAEIRYVRMGYRVRQAPYGYVNTKVETTHGKRVILTPHPEEAIFIQKMFELRALGTLTDEEIVDHVNALGFHTRHTYIRNPEDRTKVIGQRGNGPLKLKQLWRFIQNPIYAGINVEKWTQGEAVKSQFTGLVSLEQYNLANRGKLSLISENGQIKFFRKPLQTWQTKKLVNNPNYPYKRVVMCPHCNKPLFGSASRGKLGKYYPAYHCNKRGHYFRVTTQEVETTIETFVKQLDIEESYIQDLTTYVVDQWNQKISTIRKDETLIEDRIITLEQKARLLADKIKILTSEVAIKYIEADLVQIEAEIQLARQEKTIQTKPQETPDMSKVMKHVSWFLEHLEEVLLDQSNPLKRAAFFGLIFERMPTYEELRSGTPELAPYLALNYSHPGTLVPFGEPAGIRTQNQ